MFAIFFLRKFTAHCARSQWVALQNLVRMTLLCADSGWQQFKSRISTIWWYLIEKSPKQKATVKKINFWITEHIWIYDVLRAINNLNFFSFLPGLLIYLLIHVLCIDIKEDVRLYGSYF